MTKRLALLTLLAVVGCNGGEFIPTNLYTLKPSVVVTVAQPSPVVLGVRPLDYAQYYKQPMVYRESEFAVGYDTFNSWAELPRDAITRVLVDALSNTGYFADVGYAFDLDRPDLILTGTLRKLDEARTAEPWTAECEIRFELRSRDASTILWSDVLSARAPLAANDAQSFAVAANEALGRLLGQVVEEIVRHARKDS